MKIKKVNWHDSVFKDLDTSIKKDNNGFVYGLYTFEGNELINFQNKFLERVEKFYNQLRKQFDFKMN